MHEAPIVKDLVRKIEAISRREYGPRILKVKISLGALTGLSPEAFREHFRHASIGTVAERARLLIRVNRDTDDPLAHEVVLESVEIEDVVPRTVGNGRPLEKGTL
jgi:Zn finger protein HypA/HybF involved in hydrogenase expression